MHEISLSVQWVINIAKSAIKQESDNFENEEIACIWSYITVAATFILAVILQSYSLGCLGVCSI